MALIPELVNLLNERINQVKNASEEMLAYKEKIIVE